MRVPWLSTTLSYDCGPACLAMILSYHGRDASVDEIRSRLGTSRDGTNGLDLVRVARDLGLEARGVRVEGPEALAQVALPAIAHYRRGHFVVLERQGPGRSVRVLDPMKGRVEVPLDAFLGDFSGVAIVLAPGAGFRRARGRTWTDLARLTAKGNGPALAAVAALSLLLQGFAFALPAAAAFVVDRVIPDRSIPALGLVAAGIPILLAAYALSAWIRGLLMASLAWRVNRSWLDRLFGHLMRLPLPFFHGRPVEELIVRVQGADTIVDDLLDQLVAAFLDSLLAVTALVALLGTFPGMSGLVLAAAAAQAVLTWASLRLTFDHVIRDILAHARLYTFAAEALAGIADLKMVGIDRVSPTWSLLLGERVEAGLRRKRSGALWDGILGAAQTAAPLLVLTGGAALAVEGRMTPGEVVGFYSLAAVCLAPVSRLAGSAYRLRSAAEYVRRAQEILATPVESERSAGALKPEGRLQGHLRLRGVSFRYAASGPDVLKEIDLEVRPMEKVVIVGRTGSGKSTLARILATLYEPGAGDYLVDGVPAGRYDRSALRSAIGAVFQENVLVGGSILDNVTLGREMPLRRVHRALGAACFLMDVKEMPMGLATPVGAGGLHLSGGQRQRLCLARAVAAAPPILVLDEATASVDRLTERHIWKRLARLRCTRVLVTHRLYMAQDADRVIVIDEGRIAEAGTHDELIARGGLYARLWGERAPE